MKKTLKLFGIIALAAVIGFTTASCDNGSGVNDVPGTNIDISALVAVITEAANARNGVEKASDASEVPTGKKWVTESEWDAFNTVYLTAKETEINPSSQAAVDTAKTNLQASLVTFNAAKKDGSGAAITLSGTITVKNNGQPVPYVMIQAYNAEWSWFEEIRIPLMAANTTWEIITKPFPSSTEIFFDIYGYDNDKYEPPLFFVTADVKKTAYNTNVNNIAINIDSNFVTISGTLNLDYGEVIPSVRIVIYKKDSDIGLGLVDILNFRNSAAWSINIPSQTADTDVVFTIVGFDGPIPYNYDRLFALWGKDFGVKVGDQNKSGIALNLISVSGTINAAFNGNRFPVVEISIFKEGEYRNEWLANTELKSPAANTPWSIIIPAFANDTDIFFSVNFKDDEGNNLNTWTLETRTVKNTNVNNININFITISGTVNVTNNGSHFNVPVVSINISKKSGEDSEYLGQTELENPSANAPWSVMIPAFTVNTEITIDVSGYGENGYSMFYKEEVATRTVMNTDVSGINLNIALNYITLSGTVNVTYNGSTVSNLEIRIQKNSGEGKMERIGYIELENPSANAPWSVLIPAFSVDTEISIDVDGYDEDYSFNRKGVATSTVKNTNVSNIALNLGNITDK